MLEKEIFSLFNFAIFFKFDFKYKELLFNIFHDLIRLISLIVAKPAAKPILSDQKVLLAKVSLK